MNEQSESPFFPVPVRWFEVPMNTARWGFMRLSDLTEAKAEGSKGQRAENSGSARVAVPPEVTSESNVGHLLNERA